MKQSILNNVYAYVEAQVRSTRVIHEAQTNARLSIPLTIPTELEWDISFPKRSEEDPTIRGRAEFYFGDNHKGCIDFYVKAIGNDVHGKWELMLDYTAKVCAKGKIPADPSLPPLHLQKRAA